VYELNGVSGGSPIFPHSGAAPKTWGKACLMQAARLRAAPKNQNSSSKRIKHLNFGSF
jgi:hypothetical protein